MTIFKYSVEILLLGSLFLFSTKSTIAQESVSSLYVPLIGITAVPNPPTLIKSNANVTYDYGVKNFLQEIPLTDVVVVDDICGPIKYLEGDDNGDAKLDYSETWRYRCTTKLAVTTTSTTTATGNANELVATQKAYTTVVVGSSVEPPIVSIINITKVPYPLLLRGDGKDIIFTYKVNNPGGVPLSNVSVEDDKCSAMSRHLGDTNDNKLLDPTEVWLYSCTMKLNKTITTTTRVKAYANEMLATGESIITVTVVPNNKLVWMILIGILVVLLIVLILTRRSKGRGRYGRK